MLGQVAFLGILLGFVVFADAILSAFHIQLRLVPLSLGPIPVTLTFAGMEITSLVPIALVGLVYYAREGLKRLIHGQF